VKALYAIFLLFVTFSSAAQQDSGVITSKPLLVPGTLLLYGAVGTYTDFGNEINQNIQSTLFTPGNSTHLDDYLTLAPSAVVYGLNLIGVKGKHNFKDRTIIIGTSYTILLPMVYGTKAATGILRPDGSEYTSFPSGHTAFAFASAEFLRQEYKDKSPWYGIAGYAIASATGGLRIYNNRHWMTDVAAGAGLGILSTKVAYWVHPWMKRTFFHKESVSATLLPQVDTKQIGLLFSARF
jgi:membrane-associated phospholipid phosphatase